jgi:murein DD-endopeptidase MepM/ murein hydrolase activator NlpD
LSALLVALLSVIVGTPSDSQVTPASFIERARAVTMGAEAGAAFTQVLVEVVELLPGPTSRRAEAMDAAAGAAADAVAAGGAYEQIFTHRSILQRLRAPLSLGNVRAAFGERRRPDSSATERHTGWSFHATSAAQVVSSERGVVVWAGPVDGLGMTVIVAHSSRIHTVYANLLVLNVTEGAPVARGDILAFGAATDLSDRREFYFELRIDGIPVDPASELGTPVISAP